MIAAVLDALVEPALLLDGEGRVALANRAAQDKLGVWIVGRSHVSVLRQPALLGPVGEALVRQVPGHARFIHSAGEVETPFDVAITPVAEGQVLLVFRDVSDTQAGQSMRRDFVANVSHELKTPLAALSGFIETMQGTARNDAPARERFLALMSREVARMDRLVSDLLSLSRVEEQSRRRPTATVDLSPLAREAAATLRPGAEASGVAIALDCPPAAPMAGDRDQLMQVLTNLIGNALKYGARPGAVEVAIASVDRDPVIRGPAWRLSVADHGPGIAPEHLPRLTERFYRIDTGRSREQGGTGLGLAIVKHIVNRHRGRLRIDSVEGRGTIVTVLFPALS